MNGWMNNGDTNWYKRNQENEAAWIEVDTNNPEIYVYKAGIWKDMGFREMKLEAKRQGDCLGRDGRWEEWER